MAIPSRPSVSLVIVTYAREVELMEHLRTLRQEHEQFCEIIIIDNGRSDQLKHDAESLFATLRVIHPDENLGAVGRTLGILASRGDIVVTLDDDVSLVRSADLAHVISLFSADPHVACANFKIVYSDGKTLDLSDWCHPRDPDIFSDIMFDTTYISEGACAFNGDLIRTIGGYSLDLFIGQEGVELAARIMDHGFSIYYLPTVCVRHSVAPQGRVSGRQFYYNARNIYWIVLRCYPIGMALRVIMREWFTLFLFSLLRRQTGALMRGCRDGIRSTKALLKQRQPIHGHTARRIRQLNKLKPSVLARFRKLAESKTL